MNYTLLTNAVGSIEARADQIERLDEITERLLAGEFYVATKDAIPSACIDGRVGGTPRPNAAGGTNTIVVGEDLTNDISQDYIASYDAVISRLSSENLPVGGHDDEHANDEKSGCGACDRLTDIYAYLASHGDDLRSMASTLGVTISNESFKTMISNARVRNDFSSGSAIKSILESSNGTIDHLCGEHNEVIAVINRRKGTTLDREALEHEFGPSYEAFNIDVWAFPEAAKHIHSTMEANDKIAAMVLYNLATAHVLCGPSMRVIVRD